MRYALIILTSIFAVYLGLNLFSHPEQEQVSSGLSAEGWVLIISAVFLGLTTLTVQVLTLYFGHKANIKKQELELINTRKLDEVKNAATRQTVKLDEISEKGKCNEDKLDEIQHKLESKQTKDK